ncbi:hypothetical protein ACOSQ2_015389 [Xanthoceras sorbifolium]
MEVNEVVTEQNINIEDFGPQILVSYNRNGRKRPERKAGYKDNRGMNNDQGGNNFKEKYGKTDSHHGEHTKSGKGNIASSSGGKTGGLRFFILNEEEVVNVVGNDNKHSYKYEQASMFKTKEVLSDITNDGDKKNNGKKGNMIGGKSNLHIKRMNVKKSGLSGTRTNSKGAYHVLMTKGKGSAKNKGKMHTVQNVEDKQNSEVEDDYDDGDTLKILHQSMIASKATLIGDMAYLRDCVIQTT